MQTPAIEEDNPSTIGVRIRAVRHAWRWSQDELAEALRVDQASISFWERDKITPSGSARLALASLFRTSVQALEDGTGFQMPDPPSSRASAKSDPIYPRSVSLPLGTGDKVLFVDLGDGTCQTKELSDAVLGLAAGILGNRRMWVVLG